MYVYICGWGTAHLGQSICHLKLGLYVIVSHLLWFWKLNSGPL